MERLTSTPFGRRPASLGQIAASSRSHAKRNICLVDKWALLRDLTTARRSYGLTHRDLVVLNALLSFHRGCELTDPARLVVFPSNATLSQRAHGMPESTLRRHLAALTASGLVIRHDSPNGKRYAARGPDGTIVRAFGFDLAPLLHRAAEISAAAREVEATALRLKRLREEVVLALRDVLKLLPLANDGEPRAPDIDERIRHAQRAVRRKPDIAMLQPILHDLTRLRSEVEDALNTPSETGIPSANDARNERHLETHTTENKEDSATNITACTAANSQRTPTPISLTLVRRACPDIEAFSGGPIHAWSQLSTAAAKVTKMLQIPLSVWHAAERRLGRAEAAVTVACILQRAQSIEQPGAYLHALTRRAAKEGFSPLSMLVDLAGRHQAAAS